MLLVFRPIDTEWNDCPYPKKQNYVIIYAVAQVNLLVPHLEFEMRLPFCILNVGGDVLDGGEIRFLGATQTPTSRVVPHRKTVPAGQ